MKTCSRCGEEKSLESFPRLAKDSDKRRAACKECFRVNWAKQYHKRKDGQRRLWTADGAYLCYECEQVHPVSAFGKVTFGDGERGVRRVCRKCLSARQVAYYNRDLASAQRYWWERSIAKYGLTSETWNALFDSQGRKCAICGAQENGKKRFHVDHCHATGVVRGILCTKCNVGIGALQDDPSVIRVALLYLENSLGAAEGTGHN